MLYLLTPGCTSSQNCVRPNDPPWQQERVHVPVSHRSPSGKQTRRRPPILHAPGSSRSAPLCHQNLTANQRRDRKQREQNPIAETLWAPRTIHSKQCNILHKESPSLNKDYKILKDLDGPYNNQDENEARKGTADCSLSTYHRLSLLRAKPTPFLHPFLIATPLSNLSIIFFELDSLQVFLFSQCWGPARDAGAGNGLVNRS